MNRQVISAISQNFMPNIGTKNKEVNTETGFNDMLFQLMCMGETQQSSMQGKSLGQGQSLGQDHSLVMGAGDINEMFQTTQEESIDKISPMASLWLLLKEEISLSEGMKNSTEKMNLETPAISSSRVLKLLSEMKTLLENKEGIVQPQNLNVDHLKVERIQQEIETLLQSLKKTPSSEMKVQEVNLQPEIVSKLQKLIQQLNGAYGFTKDKAMALDSEPLQKSSSLIKNPNQVTIETETSSQNLDSIKSHYIQQKIDAPFDKNLKEKSSADTEGIQNNEQNLLNKIDPKRSEGLIGVTGNGEVGVKGENPPIGIKNSDAIQMTLDKQITQTKDKGISTLTMKLQPEELGKMKIQLQLSEGVLIGKIIVENEVAKNALQQHIQAMKNQIRDQGMTLESLEVNVGSEPFQGHQQQESENRPQYLHKGKNNFSYDGEMTEPIMVNNNTNTVNRLNILA